MSEQSDNLKTANVGAAKPDRVARRVRSGKLLDWRESQHLAVFRLLPRMDRMLIHSLALWLVGAWSLGFRELLAGRKLSGPHKARWSRRSLARYVRSTAVAEGLDEFVSLHPEISKGDAIATYHAAIRPFLSLAGLPTSERGLRELVARMTVADLDFSKYRGRGRPLGGVAISAAAMAHYRRELRRCTEREAWERTRVEAVRQGWAWPSVSTVRRRLALEQT